MLRGYQGEEEKLTGTKKYKITVSQAGLGLWCSEVGKEVTGT